MTLRKIIHNEMARLADLKDRILYKITALDLLIHPLSQQANRSLAHFKDVQLFLDSRGGEVAQRVGWTRSDYRNGGFAAFTTRGKKSLLSDGGNGADGVESSE